MFSNPAESNKIDNTQKKILYFGENIEKKPRPFGVSCVWDSESQVNYIVRFRAQQELIGYSNRPSQLRRLHALHNLGYMMISRKFMTKITVMLFAAVVVTTSASAFAGFTGDASADFNTSFDSYAEDPNNDVGLPTGIAGSGNEIDKVFWHYDHATDRLSVAFDIYANYIAGDVDGDGKPDVTSPELAAMYGFDCPNSGIAESFAFSLDITGDGVYDINIGIGTGDTWSDFRISEFLTPFTVAPAFAFGADITDPNVQLDLFSYTGGAPNADEPDIEFCIEGLSSLNNFTGLGDFQAFLGSYADAGIGEDFVRGTITMPEPGTMILVGIGLVSVAGITRRRIARK